MRPAITTTLLAAGISAGTALLTLLAVQPGASPIPNQEAGLSSDASALERRIRALEELASPDRPPLQLAGSRSSVETSVLENAKDQLRHHAQQQFDDTFDERVESKLDELLDARAKSMELVAKKDTPATRKTAPLSRIALELGLSSAQERDLRQIYEETNARLVEIMAGPNGDLAKVREDLEFVRDNPDTGRIKLLRYIPNVIQNADEIATLEEDRTTRIAETVGTETAAKLGTQYQVAEALPIGPRR